MDKDKLLSLQEAADIAGCSPATLRRAARLKELNATKVGTYWAVSEEALKTWIASGGYNPNMKRR